MSRPHTIASDTLSSGTLSNDTLSNGKVRLTQAEVDEIEHEISHLPDRRSAAIDALKIILVANADEMEPGTFKDRLILEQDPHQLIDGMIVSAYAIAADIGYIFICAEYHAAIARLREAIVRARAADLLVAILALALMHADRSGQITFSYFDLLRHEIDPAIAYYLMWGFFLAFVVKLPGFPFHTWLPDTHTQAPTAASVLLAGILLKTGAYGLIRFTVPLFPEASMQIAELAMTLGAAGILYGALLAFAQSDFKRLVAYSSVSHMGFVLVGVYAWTELTMQGSVVQMLAHGFSTAALFMLAGALQHHLPIRDMAQMGGLWLVMPRMGAIAMQRVYQGAARNYAPTLANIVWVGMAVPAQMATPLIAVDDYALTFSGLIVLAAFFINLQAYSYHRCRGENRTSS